MDLSTPHYLLYSRVDRAEAAGRWQFVLRAADGGEQFEASDREPGLQGERLDLLCVVRALESLDQPSCVTVVDCSDYVWKGVQYGLPEWRDNGWRWEFFGQMVPVKNSDLWQRMDKALQFHRVECRRRRFDPGHQRLAGPARPTQQETEVSGIRKKLADCVKYAAQHAADACRRRFGQVLHACSGKAGRAQPRTAYP